MSVKITPDVNRFPTAARIPWLVERIKSGALGKCLLSFKT